ncbi:MAG: cytochrome c oxidase subunit II [Bacteroidetes bacterium]|nr:MAG: cytochrome c oxidase subunit II [Bacteroidota bacterium]RLD95128.1 MAG: cytochrome c oxidase subunit II [Bacteroidota bacterium]
MYTAEPQQASNFVAGVDLAFLITLGVSIFFLIALTVIMLVFIRKYRKEKHPEAIQNEGSNKLEALWTGIPLVLVLVMFYFGWMGWRPMKNPPEEAMHVTAIARMWNFRFEYENGKFSDSLIVPINEPVILDLVALDVLHSLYIPAFRVKEDMVPGQDKVMWFIPGTPGEFDLFCTEYCGLQHSYMFTVVKVISKEEFDAWMTDTTAVTTVVDTELSLADQGWEVLTRNACNACHSSDGSKLIGPSYLGGWGGTRTVVSGREELQVAVDEAYIMRSIFDPDAEVVKGFNKSLMQPYEGMITEEEVKLIIEYLKALNE